MMINDNNDHNDDDEDDSNDEDALISECQCQYTGGAAGAIVIVNIGGFALTQSNGSVPLQVFDYLLWDSSLPVLLNASNVVAIVGLYKCEFQEQTYQYVDLSCDLCDWPVRFPG